MKFSGIHANHWIKDLGMVVLLLGHQENSWSVVSHSPDESSKKIAPAKTEADTSQDSETEIPFKDSELNKNITESIDKLKELDAQLKEKDLKPENKEQIMKESRKLLESLEIIVKSMKLNQNNISKSDLSLFKEQLSQLEKYVDILNSERNLENKLEEIDTAIKEILQKEKPLSEADHARLKELRGQLNELKNNFLDQITSKKDSGLGNNTELLLERAKEQFKSLDKVIDTHEKQIETALNPATPVENATNPTLTSTQPKVNTDSVYNPPMENSNVHSPKPLGLNADSFPNSYSRGNDLNYPNLRGENRYQESSQSKSPTFNGSSSQENDSIQLDNRSPTKNSLADKWNSTKNGIESDVSETLNQRTQNYNPYIPSNSNSQKNQNSVRPNSPETPRIIEANSSDTIFNPLETSNSSNLPLQETKDNNGDTQKQPFRTTNNLNSPQNLVSNNSNGEPTRTYSFRENQKYSTSSSSYYEPQAPLVANSKISEPSVTTQPQTNQEPSLIPKNISQISYQFNKDGTLSLREESPSSISGTNSPPIRGPASVPGQPSDSSQPLVPNFKKEEEAKIIRSILSSPQNEITKLLAPTARNMKPTTKKLSKPQAPIAKNYEIITKILALIRF